MKLKSSDQKVRRTSTGNVASPPPPPSPSPLPPPPPMPIGFHKHQYGNLVASSSRPLSPGEQFQRINIHQNWENSVAGEPNQSDLEVSGLKFSQVEMYHMLCLFLCRGISIMFFKVYPSKICHLCQSV